MHLIWTTFSMRGFEHVTASAFSSQTVSETWRSRTAAWFRLIFPNRRHFCKSLSESCRTPYKGDQSLAKTAAPQNRDRHAPNGTRPCYLSREITTVKTEDYVAIEVGNSYLTVWHNVFMKTEASSPYSQKLTINYPSTMHEKLCRTTSY
jgi:hypothetical protein